jgi:hypothetical protein
MVKPRKMSTDNIREGGRVLPTDVFVIWIPRSSRITRPAIRIFISQERLFFHLKKQDLGNWRVLLLGKSNLLR